MKKTILSGIQSTGDLTLGNYIGALGNWVTMQEEFNCYYMIADLHTLTVKSNREKLAENIKKLLAIYIACRFGSGKKQYIYSVTYNCT